MEMDSSLSYSDETGHDNYALDIDDDDGYRGDNSNEAKTPRELENGEIVENENNEVDGQVVIAVKKALGTSTRLHYVMKIENMHLIIYTIRMTYY